MLLFQYFSSEEAMSTGEDTFRGELFFSGEVSTLTDFTLLLIKVSRLSELIGMDDPLRILKGAKVL